MTEAASHAARTTRISQSLEAEARSLFGKQADAIQAHLVIDAASHAKPEDDGITHNTWISTYALSRAATMLSWAFARIERLELEAAGQDSLFDPDADVAAS